MSTLFYLGLGLIVGSFLNVLAVRFHTSRSLGGRSACVDCGKVIAWYDLVPIFSWLALRGRCRSCGVRISTLYPLTEAATGVAFVLISFAHMPILYTGLAFFIAALLIAIARYDFVHMLIPDLWSYLFSALSLVAVFSAYDTETFALDILAGPAAAAPFLSLWLVSRGRWMGLGDAKLALGVGWLLGLQGSIVATLGSFVLGAVAGLALVGFSKIGFLHRFFGASGANGVTMKSEIPFGPFLIIACFIVWFAQMYGVPLPALLVW